MNTTSEQHSDWKLSRQLPGFKPLHESQQWHREDWTESMLPEGWRPLILGEQEKEGDEWFRDYWQKVYGTNPCVRGAEPSDCHKRTRRPLPGHWLNIRTAPRDGTAFLGWGLRVPMHDEDVRIAQVRWRDYPKDSQAYQDWELGDGARGCFQVVFSDSVYSWKPTHWLPIPDAP